MAGSCELSELSECSQDTSGDDLLSPSLNQGLRRTVSQESGLSVISGVSYQPPERTPTPTQSISPDNAKQPSQVSQRGGIHQRRAAGDEIRVAIMKGRLDTIKELYLAGIDLDSILSGGWTALMYSCSYGEDEITKFLLDNGADPLYHKDMFSALMAACASRRDCEPQLLACVQYLVAAGADVNSCERHQMTPLMFAARENRSSIVSFLLSRGADINFRDCRQWTALCMAAYAGHMSMVNQLLHAGADPNVITLKGHTAFDIAEVNGKRQIAEVLRPITIIPSPVARSPVPPKLATVVEEQPIKREMANTLVQAERERTLDSNLNNVNELAQLRPSNAEHANQDLQLFLSGLDLLNYLPLLQSHRIDFPTLLLFEEKDLEQVGVVEIADRKKLLAAIFEVHRQPWTKDSLPKLPDGNLNCHDVQDMLANLTSHMNYMRTSLAFILKQLKKDNTVLTKGVQTTGGIEAILQEHQLLISANESVRSECREMQRHLEGVSGYRPYALVSYGRVPVSSKQSGLMVLIAIVGVLAAAGIFVSRKPL